MHELLHIFGFSPAAMYYWINPESNTHYTLKNIENIKKSHWYGNKETTLLSSGEVLKTTREYYGSSSIEGM